MHDDNAADPGTDQTAPSLHDGDEQTASGAEAAADDADDADASEVAADDADDEDEQQPEPEPQPVADVPYDVAFRLTVFYDASKARYGARCEELGDLEVFGASREEALREGEAMLESKIAAYAVRGEQLPKPFDLERAQDFSGQLQIEISKSLHRELAQLARRERVSLDKLVTELLADGIAGRRRDGGFRPRERDRGGRDRHDRDDRDDRRGRGKRGLSRERYQEVMEDKAAFLEYVRGLDGAGGQGGAGRGNRGGRGGWRNR